MRYEGYSVITGEEFSVSYTDIRLTVPSQLLPLIKKKLPGWIDVLTHNESKASDIYLEDESAFEAIDEWLIDEGIPFIFSSGDSSDLKASTVYFIYDESSKPSYKWFAHTELWVSPFKLREWSTLPLQSLKHALHKHLQLFEVPRFVNQFERRNDYLTKSLLGILPND